MAQVQRTRERTSGEHGREHASGAAPHVVVEKEVDETKRSIRDLVDKIDEVLEENAEEFVKNYIQRSGQ